MTKRSLPPYVDVRTLVVKGRPYTYYYYRRDGLMVRLKGKGVGDPAFHQHYAQVHKGWNANAQDPDKAFGTMGHLIRLYQSGPEFAMLKPRTQEFYEFHCQRLLTYFGNLPVQGLSRQVVLAMRDKLSATPRSANHMLSTISVLMGYAVDRGLVHGNPVQGVRRLKTGPGYRAWTDGEVTQFLNTAPLMMHVALHLGLYTGQRVGDILKMGWSHYDGSGIRVLQAKTGTAVYLPAHQKLKQCLDALPRTGLTILTTSVGQPFKHRHFTTLFTKVLQKAGLPSELVFHGLRYTATKCLVEAGATMEEVMAITGHRTVKMAMKYARDAAQEKLAKAAVKKLEDYR